MLRDWRALSCLGSSVLEDGADVEVVEFGGVGEELGDGVGGSGAVAERVVVERRRWRSRVRSNGGGSILERHRNREGERERSCAMGKSGSVYLCEEFSVCTNGRTWVL